MHAAPAAKTSPSRDPESSVPDSPFDRFAPSVAGVRLLRIQAPFPSFARRSMASPCGPMAF
jgi:hypothetical protein